jgi:hypothetical protein
VHIDRLTVLFLQGRFHLLDMGIDEHGVDGAGVVLLKIFEWSAFVP